MSRHHPLPTAISPFDTVAMRLVVRGAWCVMSHLVPHAWPEPVLDHLR